MSGLILILAVGLGVLREHGWSLRRRRAAAAAQDDESDEHGLATLATAVHDDGGRQLRSELDTARQRVVDLEAAIARHEGGEGGGGSRNS